VEVERVRARLRKGGPRHTIFLGLKQALDAADGPRDRRRARPRGLRRGNQ
jgi:hypothetical protein